MEGGGKETKLRRKMTDDRMKNRSDLELSRWRRGRPSWGRRELGREDEEERRRGEVEEERRGGEEDGRRSEVGPL